DQPGSRELAHDTAQRVAAAQDQRVVTGDDVVACAAVDDFVAVVAAGDGMPADNVVVIVAAVELVGRLAADDDVLAAFAEDRVAAAKVDIADVDRGEGE